jgi:hypothetical protein
MVRVRAGRELSPHCSARLHSQDTVFMLAIHQSCQDSVFTMTKRLKTAQVNLRISPTLKAAAERAAAADHRSLTSLIEKLLSDHAREHGFLHDGDGGLRPDELNAENDG